MKLIKMLFRKYSFLLWCVLFMGAYICYSYVVTHVVISKAYVNYLLSSVALVNKGVVHYLMDNFKFFMIAILLVACVTTLLLWLLRKGLVGLCRNLVDQENIFRFTTMCNILLNFFIAVGFVFLLGIKDNFFEMYYILFETLDEVTVTIDRMAYDVEMNWIFCDVLVLKMLFESIFSKSALKKAFPVIELEDPSAEEEEADEPILPLP